MPNIPKKILLIDDEPLYQRAYGVPLEQAGYAVAYASNGEEALKRAKAEKFDAYIVDLIMPIMSGNAFLKKRTRKKVPAIVLTTLESDTDREDALKYGATNFFRKTELDPQELVSAIDKLLSA